MGHLTALHGVIHVLPLTYNKDLQEDKEHLFDTVDTLELSLKFGMPFREAHGVVAGLVRTVVDPVAPCRI